MKRIDMIEKIDNLLMQDFSNPRKDANGGWDNWALAEDLLKMIEDQGMLPPFNHDAFYRTWRDGGNGHEWEEE